MGKRQTRRSVSLSRTAYESLQALSGALGISVSGLVHHGVSALTTGKLEPPTRESEHERLAAIFGTRSPGRLPPDPEGPRGCSYCGATDHYEPSCLKRWRDIRAAADAELAKPAVTRVRAATAVQPRSVEPIRLPAQLTEPCVKRGREGLSKEKAPALARRGRCAICVDEGVPVQRTQLDVGGPLYDVCNRCNGEVTTSNKRQGAGGAK